MPFTSSAAYFLALRLHRARIGILPVFQKFILSLFVLLREYSPSDMPCCLPPKTKTQISLIPQRFYGELAEDGMRPNPRVGSPLEPLAFTRLSRSSVFCF